MTSISKVRQTYLCGWRHTSLNNRTLNGLSYTDVDKLIDNGDMKIIDIYYKYSGTLHTIFEDYDDEFLNNNFEFVAYFSFPEKKKVFAFSVNLEGCKICDKNFKMFIRRDVFKILLKEMNEDNLFFNDKFDEERQIKEETFLKFASYRAL